MWLEAIEGQSSRVAGAKNYEATDMSVKAIGVWVQFRTQARTGNVASFRETSQQVAVTDSLFSLCVCTRQGLTASDMPTHVRDSHVELSLQHPTVSLGNFSPQTVHP
jgi:hypothetical protein